MAKVFLTNASGYIGTAVAKAALTKGYEVSALARSEESANKLKQLGVKPVKGDLKQPEQYLDAVQAADIVIHTAATNDSDQGKYDTLTIDSIVNALKGTDTTFLYTSGTWVLGDTGANPVDETQPYASLPLVKFREQNEQKVIDAAKHGIKSVVIRPVIVYGGNEGIIANLLEQAAEVKKSVYVAPGQNYWSLVHIDDLADLYVLAIEKAKAGSIYNASSEYLQAKEVAEHIAQTTGAQPHALEPEEAQQVLSFFADAFALDQKISSEKAKRELGWQPKAPKFAQELANRKTLTAGRT
ncbi:MAG TPA: NAD-dependent epimerase/dehydratase family protein [Drouetiella sp.]